MFQWYLLIVILFMWMTSSQWIEHHQIDETKIISKRVISPSSYYYILLVAFILLAGLRTKYSVYTFGDTVGYKISYINMPNNIDGLKYELASAKDGGFLIFSYIVKKVFGNNEVLFFILIAWFCLLIVFRTYREYSDHFFFSIFLFFASADYLQWNYNGMRQFIAVAIVFGSTTLILERKYLKVLLLIAIASTIHLSVIVVLPVLIVVNGRAYNKKTVFMLITAVASVLFIGVTERLIGVVFENTQYAYEYAQYKGTTATNLFRVLVYSIPALLTVPFRNRIQSEEDTVINLCVNMSLVTASVYLVSAFTSGQFIGRLAIYFSLYNYILLPWEIDRLFPEKKKLITISTVILYTLFYYYQTSIIWGLK